MIWRVYWLYDEDLAFRNFISVDKRKSSVYCINQLFSVFSDKLQACMIKKTGNLHLFVDPHTTYFLDFFLFLKDRSSFLCKWLLDLFGVDLFYLQHSYRFEVIYMLLSPYTNRRIFLHFFLPNFGSINSLTPVYSSADWLEREMWDMYGVYFKGHPDLKRILTDYGFLGHPLKKDFPLTGFVELRYDDIYQSIVSEPLELTQEFRYWKLDNPWIGDVS